MDHRLIHYTYDHFLMAQAMNDYHALWLYGSHADAKLVCLNLATQTMLYANSQKKAKKISFEA